MQTITLEEAQNRLLEQVTCVAAETVQLLESVDRILAENVYASISQPPFERSAMDGYAVRSEDIQLADCHHPVCLRVVDAICAGTVSHKRLHSGEAIRIMTGAMIPEGADCVVKQEETDGGQDEVTIYQAAVKSENCCPKGEDFHQGACLGRMGDRIDAYRMAAMASAGIEYIRVRRKIQTAIITTGEELMPPGQPLLPGKIYNANLAYLSGRSGQLGCEITEQIFVGDDIDAIAAAIKKCAKHADIILTTGGVSVGVKDLLPEVMAQLEAEILFHGIDLKPGMPTMGALYQKIPVLSLSGNPYSASAVFELLMQPLLQKMTGSNAAFIEKKEAVLARDYLMKPGNRRVLKGMYDGQFVTITKGQRNGQMQGGIGTNCLVDVPAGIENITAGERVFIWKINEK